MIESPEEIKPSEEGEKIARTPEIPTEEQPKSDAPNFKKKEDNKELISQIREGLEAIPEQEIPEEIKIGQDTVVLSEALGGKKVNYFSAGPENGPLVVFSHGWLQTGITFEDTITELAKSGYRVASVDFPGFGDSEPLEKDNRNIEAYAEALREVIAKLNAGQEVEAIVGHSMGSVIAARMAEAGGPKIKKIVLNGLPVDGIKDSAALNVPLVGKIAQAGMRAYLTMESSGNDAAIIKRKKRMNNPRMVTDENAIDQKYIDGSKKADKKTAVTMAAALYNEKFDNLPFSGSPKVLLLRGENDAYTPLERTKALAEKSGAEVGVIAGHGHEEMIDAAKEFTEAVKDFIEK